MMNKVMLLGRCGADPQVKYTAEGNPIGNLTLATSRTFKHNGESKEETEWHKLVAFGPVASVVDQYVRKGRQLFVEGRLQTRKWTDKDDVERFTTEVVVEQLHLLERARDTEQIPGSRRAQADAATV